MAFPSSRRTEAERPRRVGDGGVVLPLPERLTPTTQILPTAEEVEPWVEAIIRLWDDAALYQEQSDKAKNEAQRWHPDRLRPLYAEFFSNVRVQARPPVSPTVSGGVGHTQRVRRPEWQC